MNNIFRNNKYLFLLLILTPFIIYFYFIKWKTATVYGDDLYLFKEYFGLNDFTDKINISVTYQKYRPVYGLNLFLVIESFQKNLNAYYLFNICIQTINTFIIAKTLNLFLKSSFLSLLFGLTIGLSRFAFFNVIQLLNGGVLEGSAMTFFLLFLMCALRSLVKTEITAAEKYKSVLLSILFANLSLYTHERYIVLIPFLILVILTAPELRILARKQKTVLVLIALASLSLNVILKRYIFGIPFFVGTGGTNIEFSFSSAISFFIDAVASIFQINSGPEYLVGMPFTALTGFSKAIALLACCSMIFVIASYIYQVGKRFLGKREKEPVVFPVFIFLLILFVLCLVPTVITIRLEQRWLQAPFSIAIVMAILALSQLKFRDARTRKAVLIAFLSLILWTDISYLYKGADRLYMRDAERLAQNFKQAVDKDIIHPNTNKLYIWERKREENSENAIKWTIADGYFFEFYNKKNKKITFEDSIYQRDYSFPFSSFINFTPASEQIVFVEKGISDITKYYLYDSLHSFDEKKINELSSPEKKQYNQKQLVFTIDNFSDFATEGFHENENGIRWTNGKAGIGLLGDYIVTDSLAIILTTYMPPICKSIIPKIILADERQNQYEPVLNKHEGDKFFYSYKFSRPTSVQKISLLSDIINATPDMRTLSFPFISLELKQ